MPVKPLPPKVIDMPDKNNIREMKALIWQAYQTGWRLIATNDTLNYHHQPNSPNLIQPEPATHPIQPN